MPYTLHPSERLVALFREKPWQGNSPLKSEFVFLGLDANYATDVERACPEIFDYLADGVNFWRTSQVHHPFRLAHYKGSGKKYHDKFAEIGFTPEHAELVSFVELLHLPTTGVNKLIAADLSSDHLSFLSEIFEKGTAKYIFMSSSVVSILRQTGLFPWLRRGPALKDGDLTVLREQKGQIIYQMYHFSCYGWQLNILDKQISQIRKIVEGMSCDESDIIDSVDDRGNTDEILGISRCARCGHRLEGEIECPFCTLFSDPPREARLPKWAYMTACFLTSPLSIYFILSSKRLNKYEKMLTFSGCAIWFFFYALMK